MPWLHPLVAMVLCRAGKKKKGQQNEPECAEGNKANNFRMSDVIFFFYILANVVKEKKNKNTLDKHKICLLSWPYMDQNLATSAGPG